ncbi:uncharacterized protein LOC123538387 [Mercenaria mercenaria]|uniref:uncharacterized protein LOC123538387 n=1 Tax=Mercenaria mercenaria TaxID=6596 RepID=UPI001E1DBABA|nr:uncharacterized protein LOC123538387 [Mercenaria mercenaria]
MRNKKLPGIVLVAILLFSHTSFSRGGEQLLRYLLDGHTDHCHNHCGEHGTCVEKQGSHHHDMSYICQCDHGWYGIHCTEQYAPKGSGHYDHCYNHCGAHGTCIGRQVSHDYYYSCQCDNGWHGIHCTEHHTQPSTTKQTTPFSTATSSVTSTTTLSTTASTVPKSTLSSCDHIDATSAIAYQIPVANQNAIQCSAGSHASHEALVLTECAVPQNSSSWQQGTNVMSSCGSSGAIPDLTPIAAFDNGLYSSEKSLSGIFLGCTESGFKISLQTCGHPPHITELQLGGSNAQNPTVYYTIF